MRPYPGPGAPVRVSPDGGTEPVWSRDGRTLFCRDAAARRLVDGAVNIWRRPLAGGPARRLTSFTDTSLSRFAWSSAGRHLYYSRSTTLTRDVVLITNLRPDGNAR